MGKHNAKKDFHNPNHLVVVSKLDLFMDSVFKPISEGIDTTFAEEEIEIDLEVVEISPNFAENPEISQASVLYQEPLVPISGEFEK